MTVDIAELKAKAQALPESQRAELALALLESLDGPDDPDVDQAWADEIERRVGEIERGEVELIPGDEVFAKLRRKLG